MLNPYEQLFAFFTILWHQHEETEQKGFSRVKCPLSSHTLKARRRHRILHTQRTLSTGFTAPKIVLQLAAKVKEMMLFPVSQSCHCFSIIIQRVCIPV